MHRLASLFPPLEWLPRYRRADLRGDLSAGLTVAVMLVPQAMAYGLLAGLPPIMGLYASLVPMVAYSLFGTSRQLSVGPVAIDSLLVAAALGPLAAARTPEYIALAVLLAVMVGAIELGLGVLRLGFLVKFLSHPVVIGFTSAAALIIGLGQLGAVLGLELTRSDRIHVIVWEAAARIERINGPTAAIGLGAIAFLWAVRRYRRDLPAPLVAVAVATTVVWALRLDTAGVRIVGEVPAGLPAPAWPQADWATVRALLPQALVLAFVGYMEVVSVGRALAARHGYDIRPNQELIGVGAANLAGGLFGAYPVAGGFSRSAVNDQAGARTPLAAIITAAAIGLTLLFLTPLFHYLPEAVLGAIIMVAAFGLVNLREPRRLWRVKRADAVLLGLTFVATLTVGIQEGILIGVGASLLAFIHRTTRPHTAVLGRLPGTHGVYRNVERFPEAQTVPGLVILRIDAAFYFANADDVKARLRELLAGGGDGPVRGVVVDASSVNDLDSSAVAALADVVRDYRQAGAALYFAAVKGPVRDVMRRAGLMDDLGPDAFPFTVQEAVERFRAREGDAEIPTAANPGR